jgi:hypothetical protein
MKLFILLFCFVFFCQGVMSQTQVKRLPIDIVNFFVGYWKGEGKFASGKIIKANLRYSLSLDSCWLTATHEDLEPNRYKAMLIWGVDAASGKFLAYNFDNFQGHRQFSSDGFHDQKLTLNNIQTNGKSQFWERFIYHKLSKSTFEMTYETSIDGISWKKIDSLVFYRQSAN